MFGLFLSSTTPSSYSLAEIHIGMTRKFFVHVLIDQIIKKIFLLIDQIASLTSFLIMNAAIGELLLPILAGSFFEIEGPISFVIIELVFTIIVLIVFIKFLDYCGKNSEKYGLLYM